MVKSDAVEANGLTDGPGAGEELGLGFRAEDADVGALIVFRAVEEAALVGVELDDVGIGGARADDGPGVGVKVVLHGDIIVDSGRDADDFRQRSGDAINIVEGEADLDTGFVAAGLLAGFAGEKADGVGAPLGKDGFNGVRKAIAVSEKEHDGSDAPGHADGGDGGAAAIVEHRFPGLAENVFQHDSAPWVDGHYSLRRASMGSRAAALLAG